MDNDTSPRTDGSPSLIEDRLADLIGPDARPAARFEYCPRSSCVGSSPSPVGAARLHGTCGHGWPAGEGFSQPLLISPRLNTINVSWG